MSLDNPAYLDLEVEYLDKGENMAARHSGTTQSAIVS